MPRTKQSSCQMPELYIRCPNLLLFVLPLAGTEHTSCEQSGQAVSIPVELMFLLNHIGYYVRFELFTTVTMKNAVFCDVTLL
jgi:hypothetical protein